MSEYNVAQLDTELLIKEVKARPCLYARKEPRYIDVNYKNLVWEKVTKALYPKVWPKYDDEEKLEKVDLVQKRWKNLRACFSRELKRRKDPKWVYGVASKRRKYLYFDLLSFLNDECDNEEETNIQQNTEEINLPDKNIDDDTIVTTGTDFYETPIPQAMPVPKPTVETDNKHTNKQNTTTEENTTKLPTNSETDPNISKADQDSTNFALSLVPMLNMIPLNKRVETEIEILSVLYGFLRRDGNNNKSLKSYDCCKKIGFNNETYEAETAEELQIYNSETSQITQAYETETTQVTQAYETEKTQVTQGYETEKTQQVTQAYETEKTQHVTQAYETEKKQITQAYETEKNQITQAYETQKNQVTQAYETEKHHVIQAYETEKTQVTQAYETEKTQVNQAYETQKIQVTQTYETEKTQVTRANETETPEETQIVYIELLSDNESDEVL